MMGAWDCLGRRTMLPYAVSTDVRSASVTDITFRHAACTAPTT